MAQLAVDLLQCAGLFILGNAVLKISRAVQVLADNRSAHLSGADPCEQSDDGSDGGDDV